MPREIQDPLAIIHRADNSDFEKALCGRPRKSPWDPHDRIHYTFSYVNCPECLKVRAEYDISVLEEAVAKARRGVEMAEQRLKDAERKVAWARATIEGNGLPSPALPEMPHEARALPGA